MEVLNKTARVGLLLQPTTTRTQSANDIVGSGATNNAWTNGQTASDTFYSIIAEAGSPNANANVSTSSLNATGSTTVFAERGRTYINTDSVLPTVNMTIYCSPVVTTALLIGALQSVGQGSPTPTKTITPADTILDYKNNEGYLFSVAGAGFPSSAGYADGWILQNAVINSLTLTMSNALGDVEPRLMKAEVEFIGTKLLEGQNVQNFTPQETYIFNQGGDTSDVFGNLQFSFEGGGSINANFWKEFTFTINNNYFSDSASSDGSPNNMKRSNPEMSYSFSFPYNETTYTVLSKYRDGTMIDSLTFSNGKSVGTLGHFNFTSRYAVLTDTPRATDGDFLSINMTARLLKGSAGWNTSFTIDDNVTWSTL